MSPALISKLCPLACVAMMALHGSPVAAAAAPQREMQPHQTLSTFDLSDRPSWHPVGARAAAAFGEFDTAERATVRGDCCSPCAAKNKPCEECCPPATESASDHFDELVNVRRSADHTEDGLVRRTLSCCDLCASVGLPCDKCCDSSSSRLVNVRSADHTEDTMVKNYDDVDAHITTAWNAELDARKKFLASHPSVAHRVAARGAAEDGVVRRQPGNCCEDMESMGLPCLGCPS